MCAACDSGLDTAAPCAAREPDESAKVLPQVPHTTAARISMPTAKSQTVAVAELTHTMRRIQHSTNVSIQEKADPSSGVYSCWKTSRRS